MDRLQCGSGVQHTLLPRASSRKWSHSSCLLLDLSDSSTCARCPLFLINDEEVNMATKHKTLAIFIIGVTLVLINIWSLRSLDTKSCRNDSAVGQPSGTYAAFGKKLENGHLKHVFSILENAGYTRVSLDSAWDVLWSHEYPFRTLKSELSHLPPNKKVNHFPGSGYITNKVNLATSNLPHVPVAFKIPDQKEKLLDFAAKNPKKLFVQKSNNHRGIKIQSLNELDLNTSGTFVQEYIHNPLLIDGHKFDIGVYTIITSIQPLRAYIYDGDILFRFCPEKYHPFDPSITNKYVVGDDYLPIWKVPSLKPYYEELGAGMRDSFNAYLHSKGKNPSIIWQQIDEALRAMLLSRELALVSATAKFGQSHNFFEMIRVDFVVDEDLNVFIMEANMSPNLSSQHFPPNRLLYEQVIYNLLHLVGIIPFRKSISSTSGGSDNDLLKQPEVAFKDLVVFPELCKDCHDCTELVCQLCKPCMKPELRSMLEEAYLEHTRRRLCRRVVPPTLNSEEIEQGIDLTGLTEINQLMHKWFHGKCHLNQEWC